LMLSQMTGGTVEVKSRRCFALHNEVTNKNFVISSDDQTELQEWINLIQSHLVIPRKALSELASTDKVVWSVHEEPVWLSYPKEYDFPLSPGKYLWEIEKSDRAIGATRFVNAFLVVKQLGSPILTLKTGRIGNILKYTPEEFYVSEEGCSVTISVKTGSLVGSVKFSARIVQRLPVKV